MTGNNDVSAGMAEHHAPAPATMISKPADAPAHRIVTDGDRRIKAGNT